MMKQDAQTGYPSIDQPWLKYYEQAAITAELPKCTVFDYLWQNNRDTLDVPALMYFGKRISYRTMFENARLAAKSFAALGVGKGDIVTIFSSNTPETVYCMLGLNLLGAIPDMEYVTMSEKEAVAAVERCEARIAVVLGAILPKFKTLYQASTLEHIVALPLEASMPVMKKVFVRGKRREPIPKEMSYNNFLRCGETTELVPAPYQENAPAFIVHSGGTTGTPKGVVLSNDNYVYIAWAFYQCKADYSRLDRYMAYIPLFHAFGFGMGIMTPLSMGLTVILSPTFDERNLLRNFKMYKPNHIMASGAHVPALVNDPVIRNMDLSFFKTCGLGGSPLPSIQEEELVRFLEKHNSIAKASIGYGMSELSSAVCSEINRFYGKVGSVGIPLCKSKVKVRDTETGEELPYNRDGELCFSTPGLMMYYYKNEEETANATFVDENGDRWIRTGDLGHVDEDGFVFITERIKRIYSTRSSKGGTMFKLFPDYVANIINGAENVKESAVVCLEHPDYKHIAIAYVVLKEPEQVETADAEGKIFAHLTEELPSHCIPKAIRIVDALPLTDVGKVDYRELEKRAASMKIEC